MKYSCGNCKYLDHDSRYVYPYHCLKNKDRFDEDEWEKRIQNGYKCNDYAFREDEVER